MVVEKFGQDPKAVYRRLREEGRQIPEGVEFVGSWVTADLGRCFQLMRCEDLALLQRWVVRWCDLIEVEIFPVSSGMETAAAIEDLL